MRYCLILILGLSAGCSTLRTTDPPRTATEQFLLNEATRRAIEKLMTASLRDRVVFIDPSYIIGTKDVKREQIIGDKIPPLEHLFIIAELRSKLLQSGARVTEDRDTAQVIVEVRTVGVGIDRLDTLVGIPSVAITPETNTNVPILTPELAIVKSLKQRGFSSVAFVAYWRDTGEIVASSGPFVGKTRREDYWILGFGPRTLGNIEPVKD